ncbi:peptide/nickel transport system substrate-binding protein [Halorientalis persicus]|uniref:Peptide/nickel transport system substrate-binding protein n=1 Tax=Halorientalis persicus TaxID=1367881 RepID=A0A1H8DJ09_9EURY|nr:ABC transporter substrate-binding protein [Halorientalis persicus]SEN07311.1 peptide/nickel transport system substrate-binding protein [Halorientalis persicus]
MSSGRDGVTRRKLLAGAATGAAGASAGCLDRLQALLGWRGDGQTTLRIKTLPADADPYALRLARAVGEWLQAAGVDARIVPTAEDELRRQILVNHQFDLFVGRTPDVPRTPDTLYPLLHSTGVLAPGWRNPFGYSNAQVDDLLQRQRRATGQERRDVVATLQGTIARTQPFSILGFPETIRAVRTDRFTGWEQANLDSPLGYLGLEATADAAASPRTLRIGTTYQQEIQNLNPLSVRYRDNTILTNLLYDSLGRAVGGDRIEPWLADSWKFERRGEDLRATVRLRPNQRWHDGEPLTADDVAFTYGFITDTSASDTDGFVPVPRYHGQASLIESVRANDLRTVEFAFADCSAAVARRAFTVPILPEHVWQQRRRPATLGGVDVGGQVTEALVTKNVPAVGSGPVAFAEQPSGVELVLRRFDEHFLHRAGSGEFPAWMDGGLPFERLVVQADVSDGILVEAAADGTLDAAINGIGVDTVDRIENAAELELLTRPANSYYVLGYNTRRPPLHNYQFRRVLGRLLDRGHLADAVFDGYAEPAASPLAGTDWLPSTLEWNGDHPVLPFLGADGELDETQIQQAWQEAGFRYESGRLLGR